MHAVIRSLLHPLLFTALFMASVQADAEVSYGEVERLLGPPPQVDALRALGPDVLPHMAAIYSLADDSMKTQIAETFYRLGWPSEQARAALMRDVHTDNAGLRLQVQWALGRVSSADVVVDTLLDIMHNDGNALFRDKAACALAYDQIHLSDAQKADLYGGLIDGLSDPELQVRQIAIKALRIHTGQTRNFNPAGSAGERAASIDSWRSWLQEYRSNL